MRVGHGCQLTREIRLPFYTSGRVRRACSQLDIRTAIGQNAFRQGARSANEIMQSCWLDNRSSETMGEKREPSLGLGEKRKLRDARGSGITAT